MVLPTGTARGAHLRRTTTLTIMGVLAILLAVPTFAFASPVAGPVVTSAPTVAVSAHGVTPASHVSTDPAALARLHNAIAPLLAGPSRAIDHSHLTPLYLQYAAAGDHATVASPQREVAAAMSSLSHGVGPALGSSLTCSLSAATSADCRTAAPHPDVAQYAWQNATPGAGTVTYPGNIIAGMMTWDNYDKVVLFYGGCGYYFAQCPSNQTWAYYSGYWHNDTVYTDTPPAVYQAGFDFDYGANASILFGGCGAVCPMNETWAYAGGVWFNISAPYCTSYTCYWAPSPRLGVSMAFANDSTDFLTILFGGCLDAYCYSVSNTTYVWVAYAAAWVVVTPAAAPSARSFANMAYTASWGSLILFGGCTPGCGLANDTWEYYGGSWTNESAFNTAGGFATPPARGAAEMTYDTSTNNLLLLGGLSSHYVNDLWAWGCSFYYYYSYCGWVNITPTINLPGSIEQGAMASESSATPPLVTGGDCTCYGLAIASTWIYEPLFAAAPVITPNPVAALAPITFTANPSGGTLPYFWIWNLGNYYGYYLGDGTANYTTAGTYTWSVYAYDYYGVEVQYFGTETVTTVAAQATVAHLTTDVGVSDTFSTIAPSGGTAPYVLNWSFGDGTYGTNAASVTHAYATTGTFAANLTVTDHYLVTNMTSVSVTVVAAPRVSIAASSSTVDPGTSITFTPTASGGVGPYTYAWTLGDSHTSTSTAPAHAYAAGGSYKVNVTVTDSAGGTATSTVTVTVNPAVSGTASGTPTTLTAGSTVSFTAAGSGGSGTYTYAWVFGDGSAKVTTASATHTYATAGSYTAWVWINDTLGGSYSHSVAVTVQKAASGGSSSGSIGGLPSWGLWAIIGVVIIVLAALGALMMMRRRKPTPPATPPTGAASGGPSTPPPGAQ